MTTQKKRVIFVVPSLRGGGAERVAETLSDALLISSDIDLTLVQFDKRAKDSSGSAAKIINIDVREKGNFFYTLFKFIKIIIVLTGLLRRKRPCAVLSFMEYANSISIISNWLSGSKNKVVLSVHAPPAKQTIEHAADYRGRISAKLISRLYNAADAVISVSNNIKSDLALNFGVDKKLIHVINNPINLKKISELCVEAVDEEILQGNTPVILSVGRLSKEKGHATLLAAYSLMRDTAAKLAIVGEGGEEKRLRHLSSKLGIDQNVFFAGYQTNPYKYMKRAQIFVLPSLYEGFGLVLIEAMACGLPVIATRSYDGIENIVEHEKTGLLVPVGNDRALAEAMSRLLNDSELRRKLAENGRKKAEAFSVETIARQYKKILGVAS